MKILLVNYEYKPQCGGAGFATYNLAKELDRQGHLVELIVGWDFRFGNPEIINNVPTHVVELRKKSVHESSPLGVMGFIIKGLPLISRLTQKSDYDIIQFFFSIPTGILKYGIKRNIPYICSLRGIDVPSSRKDKYVVLRKVLNNVNSDIVRHASAVTALSNELASWFNNEYPDVEVQIIPNGLNHNLFCRKKQYNREIRRFVTVARLIKCKNIELSMRAFKIVHGLYPNITLDIIGEGYLHDELNEIIQRERMSEYIRLKGFIDSSEIAVILCEYDLFYLLTVADSFGQVFIEAMACGLPVICADIGGPKEIVVDGVTGIKVLPDDVESAVDALKYAILHPDEMQIYGENGYRRVLREYSIESVVEKHIDVFKSILKK